MDRQYNVYKTCIKCKVKSTISLERFNQNPDYCPNCNHKKDMFRTGLSDKVMHKDKWALPQPFTRLEIVSKNRR